jgi:putative transposase
VLGAASSAPTGVLGVRPNLHEIPVGAGLALPAGAAARVHGRGKQRPDNRQIGAVGAADTVYMAEPGAASSAPTGQNMKPEAAKPRRRSIRLQGWDYARTGAYFVTVCVQNRECLLGDVAGDVVVRHESGRLVQSCWENLRQRFPDLELDAFVVMPNHVHGIIVIDPVGAGFAPPTDADADVGAGLVLPDMGGAVTGAGAAYNRDAASSAPTDNVVPGGPTLGDIMRAFKSISAIAVNRHLERRGQPLWQRNYYEHIIRDEEELNRIRDYIIHNPLQWMLDRENPLGTRARPDEPWQV